MKETPYELLKDEQKKQLGKNNEANINLYNSLPHKEYERVFMCKASKERAKVTAIEVAKDLAILSLDELIVNLKVYEMVMVPIGLEEAMKIALETNMVKARDKKELATITE
nr:zf-CCHC domain-containing protein/DUF4219 domain-containing protein/UBN2 domain-containing protein [Tanacetum cinerariifolium]